MTPLMQQNARMKELIDLLSILAGDDAAGIVPTEYGHTCAYCGATSERLSEFLHETSCPIVCARIVLTDNDSEEAVLKLRGAGRFEVTQ